MRPCTKDSTNSCCRLPTADVAKCDGHIANTTTSLKSPHKSLLLQLMLLVLCCNPELLLQLVPLLLLLLLLRLCQLMLQVPSREPAGLTRRRPPNKIG